VDVAGRQVLAYREPVTALGHVGEHARRIAVVANDEGTSATIETARTKSTMGGMWGGVVGAVTGWLAHGALAP
jgi:hypothetical protein